MVVKNTLKYLRELFIVNKSYTNCLYCGAKLDGLRRKFCSNVCNDKYWREVYSGKIKRLKPKKMINEGQCPTEKELIKSKLKYDAHKIAYKKVKTDKNSKCMLCKEKMKVAYRHHEDYDCPDIVITICSRCHGFIKRYQNLIKKTYFIQLEGGKK